MDDALHALTHAGPGGVGRTEEWCWQNMLPELTKGERTGSDISGRECREGKEAGPGGLLFGGAPCFMEAPAGLRVLCSVPPISTWHSRLLPSDMCRSGGVRAARELRVC